MKEKRMTLAIVIAYGFAAAVWTIRAVIAIVYREYFEGSIALFVLNILCAVIWIAAFLISLRRYRLNEKEK